MELFTNDNERRDFLGNTLLELGHNTNVFIATAFFSKDTLISEFAKRGCKVYLIVRLGFPTQPVALKTLLRDYSESVYIRYYFSTTFHPKLYLFGEKIAFVGSSNLTDSGIFSNQELNISIDQDNPVFEELQQTFTEYWQHARVLTQDDLDAYTDLYFKQKKANDEFENELSNKITEHAFPNIKRYGNGSKTTNDFEQVYLKDYQMFLGEFKRLREIYIGYGERKVEEHLLPLRIEIDQFLNWIYENRLHEVPGKADVNNRVSEQMKEFFNADLAYLYDEIPERYRTLRSAFRSESMLKSLGDNDLMDALMNVYAFSGRARYNKGEVAHKRNFLDINTSDKIKKSLSYLVFGKEAPSKKIIQCIYHPDYKLKEFGNSCVKELYGWVNNEAYPICNKRVLDSMKWLGFNV